MGKHKKKSKKHEKKSKSKSKKRHDSSSSECSTGDEWVEKETEKKEIEEYKAKESLVTERDEWMNLTSLAGLYSHKDQRKENKEVERKEKEANKYDPTTSIRELNPYWKQGGGGLPSTSTKTKFMKPSDESDYNKYSSRDCKPNWRKTSPERDNYKRKEEEPRHREQSNSDKYKSRSHKYDSDHKKYSSRSSSSRSSNWRKKSPQRDDFNRKDKNYKNEAHYRDKSPIISVKNKVQTSEIIYECEEVFRASDKIDKSYNKETSSDTCVSEKLTDKEMNDLGAKIVKAEILGNTERVAELKAKLEKAQQLRNDPNSKSIDNDEEVLLTRTDARGFSKPLNETSIEDLNSKRKKKAVNTHDSGKRQKYYPDDGKYSLQNMFENEKFGSTDKQEEEFMKAASKLAKADDLDDMFMDNIRNKESDEITMRKDRDRAIHEHQKMSKSLDNCQHCIQSDAMLKHLMVSLGETIFLSLPQYEPITDGHCMLIPIRHVPCSTQLDENEWSEILEFRKAITNMFKAKNNSVIFYETASNLHQYPHMTIHCVPMPEEQGDIAPIYFKKGIDECEMEWSTNKKLINMAGKDVRRSVPKGLPYFWVSFGMKEGFAHVIEEQKYFPKFFAEEIIGGILDLHHSKWRKSHAQKFDIQKSRVIDFSKNWTTYDCTNK